MRAERCPLCGKEIDAGDVDAIQVHGGDGGLVHEGCIEEHNDEPGLFGAPDPESATGRAAASFECSTAEVERQRAAERRRRMRSASRRVG
jgi:hypothetical protein